MSILKELSSYTPPVVEDVKANERYEDLLESIEELYERWAIFGGKKKEVGDKPAPKTMRDPTKQLSMAKIHTVMLSPSDKSFNLKDKVFGIRNEDPIVAFMLNIMGVPMDGSPIRIRSGFMQYDERSKMLFIARFKSDLPGERKQVKESVDGADRIFDRLASYAESFEDSPHTIDSRDADGMKSDIAKRLKEGWTADEIFFYMKNMEEVDPTLDEDKALANMKRVKDKVKARLNGGK